MKNEKHPLGSLIRAPKIFQGRPSKMPSQITMPKLKKNRASKEASKFAWNIQKKEKKNVKGKKNPPPKSAQNKTKV